MALYKRPNSKYYWMKFTFDGQLVQRSTQVSSKKDAAVVESAYRTQLALGKVGIEPKLPAPTFEKAVAECLAWLKVKHKQSVTYSKYFYAFQVLKTYFGKTKVNQINSKSIEKFIVWRSGNISRRTGEPITRETINFEVFVLKILFNRLIESKILHDNPARAVKSLSKNKREFHVITSDEEKLYLLACPQPLQDVAILMLETGMRCGEVYQIRRQDVYLEKGYLKVTHGKTPSAVRRVYLSGKSADVLSFRLKKFAGENLFPQNDIDCERATYTLYRSHLTTVRKLKMKFRLYDCRHTFATRAVESGTNLLVLASILGHSNLDMVSRYAHPSEALKAEAVKRIEKRKAKAV